MALQSTDAYGPGNRQLENYRELLIATLVPSESWIGKSNILLRWWRFFDKVWILRMHLRRKALSCSIRRLTRIELEMAGSIESSRMAYLQRTTSTNWCPVPFRWDYGEGRHSRLYLSNISFHDEQWLRTKWKLIYIALLSKHSQWCVDGSLVEPMTERTM